MTTQGSSFWTTFMPHGHCYLWRPDILWLNVLSDAFIALAYFSIPIGLFWVVRKRPSIPYSPLIIMFSLFIFSCGVTHLVSIWTVWNGDYGLQGLSKAVTAIVSVATAAILVPLLPKIVALKTPDQLHLMNRQLQATIDTQHATQKRLERTDERLRTFLRQAPDGILILNKSGEIEYSNQIANTMFGYPSGHLDGTPISELVPERLRHEIHEIQSGLFDQRTERSKFVAVEFNGMRKGGSEFAIEARISPANFEDDNGGTVLASFRDISDRKNNEEKSRQEFMELAHVSRLSTVGEMAAGLAHELNQPLTAISNNLHTAMLIQRKKAKPDSQLIEIMQENYESAQRAGQIIRSLRQLVNKDDGTKKTTSINDLVETTIKLINPEARASSVQIQLDLDHSLPTTLMDTTQVQQVMVNLGRNAIEALSERFQSEADEQPDCIVKIKTTLDDPKTILVQVIDNGPGLTEEVKANLFQPYITSKESGMGLGLSICRTIVESQGGRLWHEDTGIQGTAFYFTIPVLTGE